MEQLVDLVCRNAHLSAGELTQAIVEAVEEFRADSPRSDDLTLVILKALPREVGFSYPGDLRDLDAITAVVKQNASAYGEEFAYQMELAASEIVTNILKHSYGGHPGEIRGRITLRPDCLQLDLWDDGESFDIDAVVVPDPDEPQIGGYGLVVVRQATDKLEYVPASPEGNHWRMLKHATEV